MLIKYIISCIFNAKLIKQLNQVSIAFIILFKMYKPKIRKQIIGKISFHQQIHAGQENKGAVVDKDQRKVLIIHTGGTIGMFKDQNGKFKPEPHKFQNFLKDYPYFTDADETYFNSQQDFMITPASIFGKKIWYKFHQFQNLIDSTNMSIQRLNQVCSYVKKQYQNYDAFIILHGTDTLSYTASALSFMIQNLKKTIIITGSQVPMGQIRNDAVNNLLCSLTIAGHYIIPQILVVFDNNILRGNRTTKTSASTFASFKSPNFRPLGHLGIKIQINWQLILPCKQDNPTVFHELQQPIGVMKLTPFGFSNVPRNKYLVIQSFGVGNIPTEGNFYEWIKQNAAKDQKDRAIIVNISQVYQSVILNLYATGNQAVKFGMISGSDMTCQSAVAKLSFLATKKLTFQQLKIEMIKNYRGQLTEQQERWQFQKQNYALTCMTLLQKQFQRHSQFHKRLLKNIVYPHLIIQKSSKPAITRMMEFGTDLDYVFPDGGNLLHHFCKDQYLREDDSFIYLKFLLDSKIDTTLVDKKGNSAMFYALERGQLCEFILMIRQAGGILRTTSQRIFKAIRQNDKLLLRLFGHFQDPFQYRNSQERDCLMYSIICQQKQVFNLLIQYIDLTKHLHQKDIYGKTLTFYMKHYGFTIQSESSNQKIQL